MRAAMFALVVAAMPVSAAEPLRVFAAGSLTASFRDLLAAFPAPAGSVGEPRFGPSGLLREAIEGGAPADILASADMGHPRRLHREGRAGPVVLFARNALCATGRASLNITPDTLLDRMLDPAVRLGTSTPRADPSGDYAWALFARAETVRPGAEAALKAKAQQLVGGPSSPTPLAGHSPAGSIFAADRADLYLGYCTSGAAIMKEVPGLAVTRVPPGLEVAAEYGMVLLSDHPLAARFALFVMSEPGQAILAKHGFIAPAASTGAP